MIRILQPWGRGYREVLPAPRRALEFSQRFPDDAACRDFLFAQHYPTGFACERCGGTAFRWLSLKHLACTRPFCRRKASLTARTILHGCHKPLLSWFWAAFYLSQFGTNASLIQRALKLTYKVAWTWCHKLRRVMATQTTLDAPFPPFDRDERVRRGLPSNAVDERWYFETHGNYRWSFTRSSGLGVCCQRLTRPDWELSDPEPAYELLFRDYSGSLSDKHLHGYFDEGAYRWNHRRIPPDEAAVELIARFVRTPPFPYRAIVGLSPDRTPLSVRRMVEPVTLETTIRRSRERQSRS